MLGRAFTTFRLLPSKYYRLSFIVIIRFQSLRSLHLLITRKTIYNIGNSLSSTTFRFNCFLYMITGIHSAALHSSQ